MITLEVISLMVFMGTTTISVSDQVRIELLRVAAQLQARSGEKIDYEQVIQYLLSKVSRNEQLLREACTPAPVTVSQVRRELRRGRAEDHRREKSLEARYA